MLQQKLPRTGLSAPDAKALQRTDPDTIRRIRENLDAVLPKAS